MPILWPFCVKEPAFELKNGGISTFSQKNMLGQPEKGHRIGDSRRRKCATLCTDEIHAYGLKFVVDCG